MRIAEQIVELDARTTDKPAGYVFAVRITDFMCRKGALRQRGQVRPRCGWGGLPPAILFADWLTEAAGEQGGQHEKEPEYVSHHIGYVR